MFQQGKHWLDHHNLFYAIRIAEGAYNCVKFSYYSYSHINEQMHCYYWDFAIWPFTSLIMISYWDLLPFPQKFSHWYMAVHRIHHSPLVWSAALPASPAGSGARGWNANPPAQLEVPPGKWHRDRPGAPPRAAAGTGGRGCRDAGKWGWRETGMQGNGDAGRQRDSGSPGERLL